MPSLLGTPPPTHQKQFIRINVSFNSLLKLPMTMSPPSSEKSIFSIPPFIRTIFDSFPLIQYPPYPPPIRCPKPSTRPRLYVWISPKEARKPNGGFSFDPECLKWQTYLRFRGIQYITVPSNNHACPSNSSSLPFLVPSVPSAADAPSSFSSPSAQSATAPQGFQSPSPIPAQKLAQWAKDSSRRERSEGERDDEKGEIDSERGDVQAFMELLHNEIRDALLYTTHIHRPNLHNITVPLYTQSESSIIYPLISSELSSSALAHLRRRHPGTIDRTTIFADAETALDALSGLLGNDSWFFNARVPGIMDAAVFGYLHVILTGEWEEDWAGGLRRSVEKRKNLMSFWERVQAWW